MSTFRRVFSSSVGTKLLIGLTGLALFAYLILHLIGNALIFAGPDTFNEYSHALISNPLILPIEIGLLAIFLLHVYKAVTNYVANQAARPAGYAMKKSAGHTSRKSAASSSMIWSGLVIVLFILVHVKQFKYGALVPDRRRSLDSGSGPDGVRGLQKSALGRLLRRLHADRRAAPSARHLEQFPVDWVRPSRLHAPVDAMGHRVCRDHRRRARVHSGVGVSHPLTMDTWDSIRDSAVSYGARQ